MAQQKKNTPRRSARDSRTKEAFGQALLDLLAQKPLAEIHIAEITQRAGLKRQAFYYHFADVYALMEWVMEADRARYLENRPQTLSWQQSVLYLLRHLESHKHRYADICRAFGWRYLARYYQMDLRALLDTAIDRYAQAAGRAPDAAYLQFLRFYYTQSLSAVLEHWLCDETGYTPQELVADFDTLIEDQIRGAQVRADGRD